MSVTQKVGIARGDPSAFAFLARMKSDRINLVARSPIEKGLEDEIFNLGRERSLELFESGFAAMVDVDEERVER